jgi:glycosyltransferase involved in cell wall biosynthesis
MSDKHLSIIIPTYNRASFLKKNLYQIASFIEKLKLENNINIVISNNNSSDTTALHVKQFALNKPSIVVDFFSQTVNIGLEKNALFVLEKARGKYIMYLGDDDYISFEYLEEVYQKTLQNQEISVVIPKFVVCDLDGNYTGVSRDIHRSSRLYKRGYLSCYENSWCGHQMSGLTVRRKGLLEKYIKAKVSNIYPFIYLAAQSMLDGDCYLYLDAPVKVTKVSQDQKDWNYGKDGLLNEIFDNYNKLEISYLRKTRLQIYFFRKQSWRYFNYPTKDRLKVFFEIVKGKNSTFLFKIFFSLYTPLLALKNNN